MGFLEHVQVENSLRAPRVIVYGTPGIGKTTLANQDGHGAGRTIFLNGDDGLDNMNVTAFPIHPNEPKETKYLLRDYLEIITALDALISEPHQFQVLAIDTLDAFERLIWTYTAKMNKVKNIDDLAYGKGYLKALEYWTHIIQRLDILRNQRGMLILLLSHAKLHRYDDPETKSYDRYMPDVHRSIMAVLFEWSDMVLFADHKKFVTEQDIGFGGKITKAQTAGRVLYTTETASHLAKNRYGLPPEIPLGWNSLMAAFKQSTNG